MNVIFVLAAIPLLLVLASLVFADLKVLRRTVAIALWLHAALVAGIVFPVLSGTVLEIRVNADLVISQLSAMFLVLTVLVAACALCQANFFFEREQTCDEPPAPGNVRLFYVCANLFVLAMSMVYLCNNLGYLWIAIEATTLSSAPLVYFSRTKHAVEATWKYLIICSVGIAFALLGTVLIFAASQYGGLVGGSLNLDELLKGAMQLHHPLLRLGFVFCFLGYGTKAGMFPIHSWLPDAHAEAPAPASAMLSGSLLNCALFGIWRISEVVLASHSQALARNLIVWVGTATVVAASLFLVRQHGFKRLWAYSSIENVGLMLVAIGLGSGILFFLQALNHSLAKVSLFLLSGNVVQSTGTKYLSEMRGLIRATPAWGVLLALSAFAVTGAPPFGAFISEWLILVKGADLNQWVMVWLLVAALALSFVAVCTHLGRILLGNPKPGVTSYRPISTSLIPGALVACSLLLGFVTSTAFLLGGPPAVSQSTISHAGARAARPQAVNCRRQLSTMNRDSVL